MNAELTIAARTSLCFEALVFFLKSISILESSGESVGRSAGVEFVSQNGVDDAKGLWDAK